MAVKGCLGGRRVVRTFLWADHTHQVVYELKVTLTRAIRIQSGARGSALTADNKFLEPYDSGLLRVQHSIARLRDMLQLRTLRSTRLSRGEKLYRERPEYWRGLLTRRIASLAAASQRAALPLVTTECWGVVDYKDDPRLAWDWVKELCALGAVTAAATGRWAAIATSNFCGPQFTGMWQDAAWHQRLTTIIKAAPIAPELHGSRLVRRLGAISARS